MKDLGVLKGQGLVEYALILTFVAVVVVIILAFFGPAISGVFSNIIAGL
ncbi:MAG: pilus assembly protein [Anaerolineales bacterium]|nr:pilus assembly protein [Anaerolineales bacterium]